MMNELQRIQPPLFPVKRVKIPDVRSAQLDNGIPVYLIDSGNEDILRVEILFRAGQVKEEVPLLASSANLMLTEGTGKFSAEEINKQLDYYGAFINHINEKDLSGIVLFFLKKHSSRLLELISEIIYNPAFPEPEFKALMKKRHSWYLVNREKPAYLAADAFFENIFGDSHPYGRQVREQDYWTLSRKQIIDFHSRYYTPGNMAVIISGRTDPETVILMNQYFGSRNTTGSCASEVPEVPSASQQKEINIIKPGAVQTALRIGSPTINKRHPDYPGLKIVNTILGGYFGSRLMKNIREDKGFTYNIISAVTSLDLSGFKTITTEIGPKHLQAATDEIINEIRDLQNLPVTSRELDTVRNYMLGEIVRMFDGPFATAESFRSVWEFGLDNSYFNNLSEKIIKIDPDEIIDLTGTYYKIEDLCKVSVSPS